MYFVCSLTYSWCLEQVHGILNNICWIVRQRWLHLSSKRGNNYHHYHQWRLTLFWPFYRLPRVFTSVNHLVLTTLWDSYPEWWVFLLYLCGLWEKASRRKGREIQIKGPWIQCLNTVSLPQTSMLRGLHESLYHLRIQFLFVYKIKRFNLHLIILNHAPSRS